MDFPMALHSPHHFFVLGLFALAVFGVGCVPKANKPPDKPAPAAVVSNAPKESQLSTVVLSPEAEQRLGVVVVPVAEREIKRHRVLGGEVILPPGQSVAVTAPFNGTILKPEGGSEIVPGIIVQQGQTIYRIVPMLAAEARTSMITSQIEMQQRVESAQIELENASMELKRARQLFEEGAGSQQKIDTNEVTVKLAQQALAAAQESARYLEQTTQNVSSAPLDSLEIRSPLTGVLSNFASIPGQTAVQGGLLFSVTNMDSLWIRVPVYVGQLRSIDTQQAAMIREFGQTDLSEGSRVTPILAPPSANPATATVDLFYELKSPEPWIRPGHKVAVTMQLHGNTTYRVIPWSAVIFDIYGGSWVYERTAPLTYVRQRVEIEFVDKTESVAVAVFLRGPAIDKDIVTDGASEIFGTELGGLL